jgi:hypothetical protein
MLADKIGIFPISYVEVSYAVASGLVNMSWLWNLSSKRSSQHKAPGMPCSRSWRHVRKNSYILSFNYWRLWNVWNSLPVFLLKAFLCLVKDTVYLLSLTYTSSKFSLPFAGLGSEC